MVEQYRADVQMLVQQKGSRLRNTVTTMDVVGRTAFVDQIGSVDAIVRTTRHGDSPLINTPHERRRLSLADYEWGDLVDKQDLVRVLQDPANAYSLNASWAMGRAMDDVIITALSGTSATGQTGTGTADLAAANQVAVNYVESGAATDSNLTVGKLRRTKGIFGAFDVDDMDDTLHLVTSQSQIDALLRDDEVTSADFNTVKALVNGEINTYMGFQFHRTQRLTIDSNNVRTCLAYAPSGIRLGIGIDITARIEERADKSFATYVYYMMSLGAVRLEEEKVVEVSCDEDL
jgi:hypothetical protein